MLEISKASFTNESDNSGVNSVVLVGLRLANIHSVGLKYHLYLLFLLEGSQNKRYSVGQKSWALQMSGKPQKGPKGGGALATRAQLGSLLSLAPWALSFCNCGQMGIKIGIANQSK